MKNVFIHEKALVDSEKIGEKTTIWGFTHILKGAVIGKNANVNEHCFVENDVVIGDNVTIKSGVFLWDGITVEDNVFIGPSATFTNDLYPRSKHHDYMQKKTLLQKGCSIGANATILGGVTIGQYALVGAGSVVTKDVSNFVIVVGNPAKKKGYICMCAKKLIFKNNTAACKCGKVYVIQKGIVYEK